MAGEDSSLACATDKLGDTCAADPSLDLTIEASNELWLTDVCKIDFWAA